MARVERIEARLKRDHRDIATRLRRTPRADPQWLFAGLAHGEALVLPIESLVDLVGDGAEQAHGFDQLFFRRLPIGSTASIRSIDPFRQLAELGR